jgi:hypothetical protein
MNPPALPHCSLRDQQCQAPRAVLLFLAGGVKQFFIGCAEKGLTFFEINVYYM